MLKIFVLKHYYVRNRIPDTKTNQHQCHTSCNTENRHKQTFLVPEKIPKRRFPGKVQMFP